MLQRIIWMEVLFLMSLTFVPKKLPAAQTPNVTQQPSAGAGTTKTTAATFTSILIRANTLQCLNGKKMIDKSKFCDGNNDCNDGSDEYPVTCNTTRCTSTKNPMTSCDSLSNSVNATCLLPRRRICLGKMVCRGKTPCTEGCTMYFLCPDGECKKRATVCNSDTCDDCKGFQRWKTGHGFKCSRNGGKCNLPQFLLYDGVKDCDDGSDMCYAVNGGPLTNIPSDIRNSSFAKFNTRICFQCLDKSMIVAATSVCDGIIDCPDMTDECLCEVNRPAICDQVKVYTPNSKAAAKCPVGDLICSDGSCVKRNKVCDGIVDCKDAMDEQFAHCGGTMPCKNATMLSESCRCSAMASATCVQKQGTYCNGRSECIRRMKLQWYMSAPEDECSTQCQANVARGNSSLSSKVNCTALALSKQPRGRNFVCWKKFNGTEYRKMINQSKVCDGYVDCPMNVKNKRRSDENRKKCNYRFSCKTPTAGVSIRKAQVCDGFEDCNNGADEKQKLCGRKTLKRFYCSALGGKKLSISRSEVCDFTINCDNQMDETSCSTNGRFYCENSQPLFVRKRLMYNGIADCSDWSDECPTLTPAASTNVFSSRYELIANPILRVLVWVMGILALGGNLGVFLNEVHFLYTMNSNTASLRTNHMLVLSLSIADTLMGIYLIMLGAASVKYQGIYCSQDYIWRTSSTCSAMGVLVVLSSETSVMTMVLLTAFRLYAVYNPINATIKPKTFVVLLVILLSWTISFFLALMPFDSNFQNRFTTQAELANMPYFSKAVVEFSSFQIFMNRLMTFGKFWNTSDSFLSASYATINNAGSWREFQNILPKLHSSQNQLVILGYFGYYSSNSVCIPKMLVTTADNAWVFSFCISLINFLAFIFVTTAYVVIYAKSSGGVKLDFRAKGKKKKVSKQVKAVQRKIFRLILTDFCCWVPLSIMAFLSLGGVQLAPVAYAVSAIVLLPLNSALNPIAYSSLFDKIGELLTCKKKENNRESLTSSTAL